MPKTRKQKLKVKDFQKKKLKVGKDKAKASNATDTSFVSKTISIRSQHLGPETDVTKRIQLLKHHNSTVKKETLQAFHKIIPRIINSSIMTPLLNQSIPLICDDSRQVRTSLIDFVGEVGDHDAQVLRLHCKMFVLYINMAMTHIIPSIQNSSTNFLKCLLKYCAEEICSQSFVKLLVGLFNVLGWGRSGKNLSSNAAQNQKRDSKQMAAHLETLYELIRCGCTEIKASEDDENGENTSNHLPNQNLIPDYPQPYEHLKLFSKELQNKQDPANGDIRSAGFSTQDVRARRLVIREQFVQDLTKHCESLTREGGETGKWANSLNQLLVDILQDV